MRLVRPCDLYLSRFLSKNRSMRIAIWIVFALSVIFSAGSSRSGRSCLGTTGSPSKNPGPNAIKSPTGVRLRYSQEGTGEARPLPGDVASVLYQGRLLDGHVFGIFLDPAKPFMVRVWRDELISAWRKRSKQMKRGEKRLIIVPFELAYAPGDPPRVPVAPRWSSK